MKPKQTIILAKYDKYHFVTYCRHGVIHVRWGMTTFHLSPDEFVQLIHILEKGRIGVVNNEICNETAYLCQDEQGNFELFLDDVRLLLKATDFLHLLRLVQKALEQWGYEDLDYSQITKSPTDLDQSEWRGSSFPFSLN